MKVRHNNSSAQCDRCGAPSTATDRGKHGLQLARHQAQCRICRHPQREGIEQDFIDWAGPRELVQNYKLAGESAIYRHAHALGLFERRRANLLGALDRFIQHVGEVRPTAGAIVSAIRLSAQLSREAAASRPSQNGIVLSFSGMPVSDAVLPRQDAEVQNRLPAGESVRFLDTGGVRQTPETGAPPENGSPRNNPHSAKGPSRDRQRADGLGHSPHLDAKPGKRSAAPIPARRSGLPAAMSQPPTPPALPVASGKPSATAAEMVQHLPAVANNPAAPQSPSPPAPSSQNAAAREPDSSQVAGMAWPWSPGKRKLFARRARSCPTRPVP